MSDLTNSYFTLTTLDDIAVATFDRPHLSDEDNVEQLGYDLMALVDKQQFRKVVLVLGGVEYVNSSVLGKFITLHRKLGRLEGRLVLCSIHGTLREILEASRLLTYFTTTASVDDAIASFTAVS